MVTGSNGKHTCHDVSGPHLYSILDITHSGQFGGVHLVAAGQRHSALIGRSFLMHFKMTYDGRTGAVELEMP